MDEQNKKYNCKCCSFYSNYASESNKHINSMKHQRNGKPKEKKIDIFNCEKCKYKGNTHWNLKMHNITQHSTLEERSKQKYYCIDCDKLSFLEDKIIFSGNPNFI